MCGRASLRPFTVIWMVSICEVTATVPDSCQAHAVQTGVTSHFTKGVALLLKDRMKLIRAAVQWSVNRHAAIDQATNYGNHER